MKKHTLLITLLLIFLLAFGGCAVASKNDKAFASNLDNVNQARKSAENSAITLQSADITVEQMYNYLQNAQEHYPLSDEFIEKYQQKDGGYIELAESLGILVDRQQHSPNQKWHFFDSWLNPKIADGEIALTDKAKGHITGLLCPELLLWIYEACGVDPIKVRYAMNVAISAKTDGTHISTMAKNMRACVTWEDIAECFEAKVATTSIQLSESELQLEVDGDDKTISATTLPANATEKVLWVVTGDKDCISINVSNNKVTVQPVAYGTATIKAICNSNVFAECSVTVTDNAPPTIVDVPNSLRVAIGKSTTLTPSLNKGSGTFTFASQNPDIATVSASGIITGISVGNTQVTISSNEYPSVSKIIDVAVFDGTQTPQTSTYTIVDDLGTGKQSKQFKTADAVFASLTLADGNVGIIDSISKIEYIYGGGYGTGDNAWYDGKMLKFGTSSINGSITFELNKVVNYVKITGYVGDTSAKLRVGDSSSTDWSDGADNKTTLVTCSAMTKANKNTVPAGQTSTITISFAETNSVTLATTNKKPLYITSIEFGYDQSLSE